MEILVDLKSIDFIGILTLLVPSKMMARVESPDN